MATFTKTIQALESWKLTPRQLAACSKDVVDNGRQVFDSAAKRLYSAHPHMRGRVTLAKDSVAVAVYVSEKPIKLSECDVEPALSVDTTGRNRRSIRVMAQPVKRAFIWRGKVFQRDEFGKVKRYSPDATPADILADVAATVGEAMHDKLLDNINKRLNHA